MAKQDLRIIKTHRQLEQALLNCLQTTPFHKITIEQLCQKAMVNRSTFYSYYQDKEDFLKRFIEQQLSLFKEKVDVQFILANPMHIHDTIYMDSFQQILQFLYERREIFMTLWEADIPRKIYDEMLAIIRWGLQHPHTIAADELEAIMASNMRIGMFQSFKHFTKKSS